jgi:hypothetical protein
LFLNSDSETEDDSERENDDGSETEFEEEFAQEREIFSSFQWKPENPLDQFTPHSGEFIDHPSRYLIKGAKFQYLLS